VTDANPTKRDGGGKHPLRFGRVGIVAPLAVVLVLAVGAGVAAGMAASGNPVIHSCYTKASGRLRIISGTKCHKREKSLSWNQKGPQGDQGPQGPKGMPGAQGNSGPQGAPGQPTTIDGAGSDEAFVCADGSCPNEGFAAAICPSGEVPISGGYQEDPDLPQFVNTVLFNDVVVDNTTGDLGWGVDMVNIDSQPNDGGFWVDATCASVSGGAAAAIRQSATPLSRLKARAAHGLHSR
jgi:hypothetical protein